MACEMISQNGPSNPENKTIPSIEITLTTFNDDENGEISQAMTGTVKIDGEEEGSKDFFLGCSIFKSVTIRNLLTLSFGQFLFLMAFNSLANLQSTINGEGGVGTMSLAIVYGIMTISSFFLPTVVIKSLGCKKTLVFSMIGFAPYMLGNFYPSWETLIPTAVVCGLASGPLWAARSKYLNQISNKYARLHRTSIEVMNAWFFSVCTTFQQNTEIWGNILSYYVLKNSQARELFLSRSVHDNCGPEFLYDEEAFSSNITLHIPSVEKRYILVTIFTALALMAAFFMAFFLDPLESEETEEAERRKFTPSDLLATLYQLAKLDQVFLLPLSLYTGLVDGFYNGDYTKAYVACAWGVPHVAAVSICYGVVSALVDSTGGPCVQILGRAGLFFLAAIAHLAMFLALTMWRPDPVHTAGFFLIASAHGIGNGVWMSQLVAFYGVLFKNNEEAAFSCFYFLNSLGFILAYSFSSYLSTKVKLFIPLTILVIGLVCYLAVEIRMAKKNLAECNRERDK